MGDFEHIAFQAIPQQADHGDSIQCDFLSKLLPPQKRNTPNIKPAYNNHRLYY